MLTNKITKAKALRLFAALAAAPLMAGCAAECCCHLMPGDSSLKAVVNMMADWKGFTQEEPTGLTAICYGEDGTIADRRTTGSVDYAQVRLDAGMYHFLAFNQSEGEFGAIELRGLDNDSTAEVTGREYDVPSWVKVCSKCIEEPEWFAVGTLDSLMIDEDIIMRTAGGQGDCKCAHDCDCQQYHDSKPYPAGPVNMENILYEFKVKINIHEIQNLRAVRSIVSGLADGRRLFSSENNASTAGIICIDWHIEVDPDDDTEGYAHATFRSFGPPAGWDHSKDSMVLQVQMMLVDGGTVVAAQMPIGEIVRVSDATKSMEVETTLLEPLPNVFVGGGGGFSAAVDDWGEAEDLEVGS